MQEIFINTLERLRTICTLVSQRHHAPSLQHEECSLLGDILIALIYHKHCILNNELQKQILNILQYLGNSLHTPYRLIIFTQQFVVLLSYFQNSIYDINNIDYKNICNTIFQECKNTNFYTRNICYLFLGIQLRKNNIIDKDSINNNTSRNNTSNNSNKSNNDSNNNSTNGVIKNMQILSLGNNVIHFLHICYVWNMFLLERTQSIQLVTYIFSEQLYDICKYSNREIKDIIINKNTIENISLSQLWEQCSMIGKNKYINLLDRLINCEDIQDFIRWYLRKPLPNTIKGDESAIQASILRSTRRVQSVVDTVNTINTKDKIKWQENSTINDNTLSYDDLKKFTYLLEQYSWKTINDDNTMKLYTLCDRSDRLHWGLIARYQLRVVEYSSTSRYHQVSELEYTQVETLWKQRQYLNSGLPKNSVQELRSRIFLKEYSDRINTNIIPDETSNSMIQCQLSTIRSILHIQSILLKFQSQLRSDQILLLFDLYHVGGTELQNSVLRTLELLAIFVPSKVIRICICQQVTTEITQINVSLTRLLHVLVVRDSTDMVLLPSSSSLQSSSTSGLLSSISSIQLDDNSLWKRVLNVKKYINDIEDTNSIQWDQVEASLAQFVDIIEQRLHFQHQQNNDTKDTIYCTLYTALEEYISGGNSGVWDEQSKRRYINHQILYEQYNDTAIATATTTATNTVNNMNTTNAVNMNINNAVNTNIDSKNNTNNNKRQIESLLKLLPQIYSTLYDVYNKTEETEENDEIYQSQRRLNDTQNSKQLKLYHNELKKQNYCISLQNNLNNKKVSQDTITCCYICEGTYCIHYTLYTTPTIIINLPDNSIINWQNYKQERCKDKKSPPALLNTLESVQCLLQQQIRDLLQQESLYKDTIDSKIDIKFTNGILSLLRVSPNEYNMELQQRLLSKDFIGSPDLSDRQHVRRLLLEYHMKGDINNDEISSETNRQKIVVPEYMNVVTTTGSSNNNTVNLKNAVNITNDTSILQQIDGNDLQKRQKGKLIKKIPIENWKDLCTQNAVLIFRLVQEYIYKERPYGSISWQETFTNINDIENLFTNIINDSIWDLSSEIYDSIEEYDLIRSDIYGKWDKLLIFVQGQPRWIYQENINSYIYGMKITDEAYNNRKQIYLLDILCVGQRYSIGRGVVKGYTLTHMQLCNELRTSVTTTTIVTNTTTTTTTISNINNKIQNEQQRQSNWIDNNQKKSWNFLVEFFLQFILYSQLDKELNEKICIEIYEWESLLHYILNISIIDNNTEIINENIYLCRKVSQSVIETLIKIAMRGSCRAKEQLREYYMYIQKELNIFKQENKQKYEYERYILEPNYIIINEINIQNLPLRQRQLYQQNTIGIDKYTKICQKELFIQYYKQNQRHQIQIQEYIPLYILWGCNNGYKILQEQQIYSYEWCKSKDTHHYIDIILKIQSLIPQWKKYIQSYIIVLEQRRLEDLQQKCVTDINNSNSNTSNINKERQKRLLYIQTFMYKKLNIYTLIEQDEEIKKFIIICKSLYNCNYTYMEKGAVKKALYSCKLLKEKNSQNWRNLLRGKQKEVLYLEVIVKVQQKGDDIRILNEAYILSEECLRNCGSLEEIIINDKYETIYYPKSKQLEILRYIILNNDTTTLPYLSEIKIEQILPYLLCNKIYNSSSSIYDTILYIYKQQCNDTNEWYEGCYRDAQTRYILEYFTCEERKTIVWHTILEIVIQLLKNNKIHTYNDCIYVQDNLRKPLLDILQRCSGLLDMLNKMESSILSLNYNDKKLLNISKQEQLSLQNTIFINTQNIIKLIPLYTLESILLQMLLISLGEIYVLYTIPNNKNLNILCLYGGQKNILDDMLLILQSVRKILCRRFFMIHRILECWVLGTIVLAACGNIIKSTEFILGKESITLLQQLVGSNVTVTATNTITTTSNETNDNNSTNIIMNINTNNTINVNTNNLLYNDAITGNSDDTQIKRQRINHNTNLCTIQRILLFDTYLHGTYNNTFIRRLLRVFLQLRTSKI